MTLWEIDIHPLPGLPDREAQRVREEAADLGFESLPFHTAHGYLIQGDLEEGVVQQIADRLLADRVVESTVVALVGSDRLAASHQQFDQLIQVLPKPGVTDPVAQSVLRALEEFQIYADAVRTLKKYWTRGLSPNQLNSLCSRVLANDSIEHVVIGRLELDELQVGATYRFERVHIPICELGDAQLMEVSREGQLYLTLVEMQTIQAHFRQLDREPTDIELESIAQTWSEHCSHKTLAGRIAYRDENGERQFDNMLKETIFAATQTIRSNLQEEDWCVSVFEDNAGIVRFDDQHNVVFKVETHNHPSALEPYGGANTGIGGVIRDPLGTGLGARPVCNTDIFCFAPPDTPGDDLPPGVLHPRRVMKGVVAGVRDYGNRMGIPTVNGALYFDPRYLGNPLVYCGNVGILPRDKCRKQPQPNDWIVALGGRTGRDGIHGATFSSAELTSESESLSGGAVQIGNAVTEKMLMDVLLEARDRNLYHAVTDCGAGGFSSAVGEMGEKIGAEVWLERAPLKYEGLSYTEIWISEAQERMVLSIGEEDWAEFAELCRSEGVEATIIGKFVPTGRLVLKYHDHEVGQLDMKFLHDGRPPVVRQASYQPRPLEPLKPSSGTAAANDSDPQTTLLQILGSLNVASKEWVIRQYDHEVLGGSVVRPLVGVENDGPSDAAVLRPILASQRGIAVSCGMNPYYGDFDTYHMAASGIDEALRNCIAVGADPDRIAILDNFCWGYTDRPETLGSLVRAAIACYDMAVAFGTPFISGKDSLNNEFSYELDGVKRTIAIPPTLLISALGQIDDVRRCVTMDLKQAGSHLYLVGLTRNELGGSHYSLVRNCEGGTVPRVEVDLAKQVFRGVHAAIQQGCARACHDLSEGGLAVALAEMAFAGGLGADVQLDPVACDLHSGDVSGDVSDDTIRLFSESNSRFLLEVPDDQRDTIEKIFATDVPLARIGTVTSESRFRITSSTSMLIDCPLAELKEAWQAPLRWS